MLPESEKWSSQLLFLFKQLEKRSLTKIRASTGFEPVTFAIALRYSTNWTMKLHIGSEVNLFIWIISYILHIISPLTGVINLIERLSLTLRGRTSNGKRQKWNFCRLSLACWTAEWKYLYFWRLVGDIVLFLCDLMKN